jgi:hypothetical protein
LCLTGKQTSRYEFSNSFNRNSYVKSYQEEELKSENDYKTKYFKLEYRDFLYSIKDISHVKPKAILKSSKNPDYIVFLVPLHEYYFYLKFSYNYISTNKKDFIYDLDKIVKVKEMNCSKLVESIKLFDEVCNSEQYSSINFLF